MTSSPAPSTFRFRHSLVIRHLSFVIAAALCLTAVLDAQQAAAPATDRNAVYEHANQLYEQQEYEKARTLYKAIAAENLSREVCFNLANAEFRLGKFGHACLWYQRALILDPGMVESEANLRLLERKLGYLKYRHDGILKVVGWLKGSQWTSIKVAGIWMFLLGVAVLLVLRPRQPWGGIVLALTICGPLIAILGGIGDYIHSNRLDLKNLGIVVENQVTALNGPFPDAASVIVLPAGTEVRIEADRGNWYFLYIPTQEGIAGWTPKSAVEPLWPYDVRP